MSFSESSAELSAFLADFGVAVTLGATTGVGILDMPDQIIGDGMSISSDYALLCKFSEFGGASYGSAITVDGTSYTVRRVEKIDDGKFCRVYLSKT